MRTGEEENYIGRGGSGRMGKGVRKRGRTEEEGGGGVGGVVGRRRRGADE